jgi:hypothetical protein
VNVYYWPWAKAYARTVFAFRQYHRVVWSDDAAYCLDRVCE